MFQLILPFQLELPFDPSAEGQAADVQGQPQARSAQAGPARVRRPRVRARAQVEARLDGLVTASGRELAK